MLSDIKGEHLASQFIKVFMVLLLILFMPVPAVADDIEYSGQYGDYLEFIEGESRNSFYLGSVTVEGKLFRGKPITNFNWTRVYGGYIEWLHDEPTQKTLKAWESLYEAVLKAAKKEEYKDLSGLRRRAAALGMELSKYRVGESDWLVLRELERDENERKERKGRGVYLIRMGNTGSLEIGVLIVHPRFDYKTRQVGSYASAQGVRVVWLSTFNRRVQTSTQKGETELYDPAHDDDRFISRAAKVFYEVFKESVIVEPHGYSLRKHPRLRGRIVISFGSSLSILTSRQEETVRIFKKHFGGGDILIYAIDTTELSAHSNEQHDERYEQKYVSKGRGFVHLELGANKRTNQTGREETIEKLGGALQEISQIKPNQFPHQLDPRGATRLPRELRGRYLDFVRGFTEIKDFAEKNPTLFEKGENPDTGLTWYYPIANKKIQIFREHRVLGYSKARELIVVAEDSGRIFVYHLSDEFPMVAFVPLDDNRVTAFARIRAIGLVSAAAIPLETSSRTFERLFKNEVSDAIKRARRERLRQRRERMQGHIAAVARFFTGLFNLF